METQVMIQTDALTKTYNGQTAVDHLSFSVKAGEIFGFLGPNGAGKTTTLLMLLGLTEPTSGTATVVGVDPVRDPITVKRNIGYLQENMGFYRDLDARQMLRYIAELNGLPDDTAEKRVDRALNVVGLQQEARKKIQAYSRGMRQRLGLAEVLVKEPKVVFLDEPTLGLDPDATNRMLELIQRLSAEQHMTVLLSSHLLYQVQRICTRVGIMFNGRMVAQGSMDELVEEKFGVGKEEYSLEELYMKYFQDR
jgi:ABC-2 type transport system ATP-binding protein